MPLWRTLPDKQFGTYVEYLAKLFFIRRGDDIYLPEIDNKGIDFVVRTATGHYQEVQVRGRRRPDEPKAEYRYFYIEKSIFPVSDSRFLFLALYGNPNAEYGDYYLIPATAWLTPNELFKDRLYDKPTQKSEPEWGLYLRDKNLPLLEPYRVALQV